MVEYTPYNRPDEQGRPNEQVRRTTVVNSGSGTGVIAAVVLFILFAIGAFVFWAADQDPVSDTAAPGVVINEQSAPATDPAQPVPAPDAPAIAPDAAPDAAPAAPAETAPAPAGN